MTSKTTTGPATDAETLLGRLGVRIDPELLVLALTHRSFAHEHGGLPTNERLEFLGDSVLGVVVTERLYRDNPDVSEGTLARMRAAVVSQRALSSVGRALRLGDFILLGRGEQVTGGKHKDSILSDTVEALIGATYLCHGLETVRAMIERLVAPLLQRAAELGAGLDWKTSLQELAANAGLGTPAYSVTGSGPDHARVFEAVATVDGREFGRGGGRSKKVAEHEAAQHAYETLKAEVDAAPDDATEDAAVEADGAVPEGAGREGTGSDDAVPEGAASGTSAAG